MRTGAKLWWKGRCWSPFSYIWRHRPPTKIAAMAKNRKFCKKNQ
jgi:hypothetical protein